MSDYHIREINIDVKGVKVVFHIPIESSNNNAGVNWQDAIVLSHGGQDNIHSSMSDISIDEEIEIKAGSIHEIVKTVIFSSIDLTDIQRLEEIKAAYHIIKNDYIAEKKLTLKFYGKSGDI